MAFADVYFSKQKGFKPCFAEPPSGKLRFVVVIPAFREPELISALESLYSCNFPEGHIEVIVVLNMPENAGKEAVEIHRISSGEASSWIARHSRPEFRFLLTNNIVMPLRDAGVGLARKTGMDQALFRFNCIDNPGGFILSFDADSLCQPNYFTAIEASLKVHPLTKGFNICFRHPVSGTEYSEKVFRGITAYEMHLRYMNLFTRYTGFPHAYHTVGSCFGVRADIYAREGGMNKRKAGEDFYFLHKIIPLGEFREINDTCITPSPRQSDRVPFGTGMAIGKFLASDDEMIYTYPPECFHALKFFFLKSSNMYCMTGDQLTSEIAGLPESIRTFLYDIKAHASIMEINANSGSQSSFVNRFFRWFDAFRIVKFLNFASRIYYRQLPVNLAVQEFLRETGRQVPGESAEMLFLLREIESKRE